VADDDDGIRDALGRLLIAAGYDVEVTADGMGALQWKVCPDLILLDNKLSGMEGMEICRQLKSNPDTSGIPVILISAAHDIAEKAAIAKADYYLSKPFSIKNLLEQIRKLIG